jgi:hypothetical protein
MAEESTSTPSPNDDALGRIERRIESLEFATQRENRWWRGGLIAALVLVALSILIAGHHRYKYPPMMETRGCEGARMMPYGPPPPPYWGYGPGGGYYGPPEGGPRQWNGPGPEAQPRPPKG